MNVFLNLIKPNHDRSSWVGAIRANFQRILSDFFATQFFNNLNLNSMVRLLNQNLNCYVQNLLPNSKQCS